MSTEEISAIWAEDVKIDESNLGGEAKKIPILHNKYYGMYYKEALKVKKLRYDYKELELAKREYYDGSMAEEDLRDVEKIIIIGCGSAFHAGMIAKYAIEHWTRIPVEVELASEFRYRSPIIDAKIPSHLVNS